MKIKVPQYPEWISTRGIFYSIKWLTMYNDKVYAISYTDGLPIVKVQLTHRVESGDVDAFFEVLTSMEVPPQMADNAMEEIKANFESILMENLL